ncbi:MAG: 50S ribosomal protein L10 [Thermoplasmatales archaeon]|nr:MAG: 50S ribosomal protein L10 [Thermoplasmatales archaeon]
MAHVAKWKFGEVERLSTLLIDKKIVGIAEIGGIPGPQLQKMRENIREKAKIRCAKNSLITRALDEADKKVKGISGLKNEIKGQTAIITTDMNPFKLFKEMKSTRTMAPAKGGETATHDIEVKKGDTPFKPGPVVGELQKVGIPAAIQEGKVVIKTDKVIVPAGEKIPVDVAQMLTRLEIFPIEIGMNLHAVFEDGTIYKPNVLDIDMSKFMIQIQQASSNAFNLAIEMAWPNKSTITHLLLKAHRNAYTLALEKNIYTKDTIKQLLSKAHASMLSIASHTKDALDDDLKKKLT